MKGSSLDAYVEYAEDEGLQRFPAAQSYVRKPTLANAEALLDALQLHVPFRSVSDHLSEKRANTSPMAARVMPPSKRRRIVSVQGGAASQLPFSKKIQILSHLDFLHDIHINDISLTKDMYDPVLLPLGLNTRQYAQVTKLCKQNEKNATFTTKIANVLESMFQKSPKRTILEKITADLILHKWVREWMQKDVLEVVFDGTIGSAQDMKIPSIDPLRTVCMMAFFSLLVGRCSYSIAVEGRLPRGTKKIEILTGAFQSMDSTHWEGFIQKFVDEFNKEIKEVRMVLTKVPLTIQPLDRRMQCTSSEITLDQVWNVPFVRKDPKMNGNDCAFVRAFQKKTYTTYPKTKLKAVFLAYTRCTKQEKEQLTVFLDRMIRLNAMRDMYKADVAIQRGAIYLTVDRIAHLYYTLQCEEQKKEPQGIYYFPVTFGETQVVTHYDAS